MTRTRRYWSFVARALTLNHSEICRAPRAVCGPCGLRSGKDKKPCQDRDQDEHPPVPDSVRTRCLLCADVILTSAPRCASGWRFLQWTLAKLFLTVQVLE